MQKGQGLSAQQYYQRFIARQRESGLSISQFCARNRISAWCFYYWRKRLSLVADDISVGHNCNRAPLQRFIPVSLSAKVTPAESELAAEIVLSESLRIKIPANYPLESIRALIAAVGYSGGIQ